MLGYNTTISLDDEVTVIIDFTTKPEPFETVLEYVSTRTASLFQYAETCWSNMMQISFG